MSWRPRSTSIAWRCVLTRGGVSIQKPRQCMAFRWKIFLQSHYCLNMPVKSLAILAMQAFWLLTMVKRSTSPLFAMNLQSTASLSQSCLLWTLCYPDYGRQKTANGRDWRNSPSHWVLSMTRLRRTARSMIPI